MYSIYFEDNTVFQGGTIEDSKWNDIPLDKSIIRVEYTINEHKVVLEGYEAYNHIVEKTFIVNQGCRANKLILMVKKDQDVMLIVYDLVKQSFKPDLKIFGKEYNNKPVKGWKRGVLGQKGKIQVM